MDDLSIDELNAPRLVRDAFGFIAEGRHALAPMQAANYTQASVYVQLALLKEVRQLRTAIEEAQK